MDDRLDYFLDRLEFYLNTCEMTIYGALRYARKDLKSKDEADIANNATDNSESP